MVQDLPVLEALRVDLAALRRRDLDLYEVEAALPLPWLASALGDTDAEVSTEGTVKLRLMLQPHSVIVIQGSLAARFSVPCGRCLAPAAVVADTEIVATFMPGSSSEIDDHDEDDEQFDPEDESPDVWRYTGSVLQLDALVAEQVALAYPMSALCERGDDCRGLCSNCGYELNTVPANVLQCPKCHSDVPRTPASGPAPEDAENPRQEREADSPLAAALRKLNLD
ncbi:MAG: DUF177 domain-containing protein [Myxococcota bacterium]